MKKETHEIPLYESSSLKQVGAIVLEVTVEDSKIVTEVISGQRKGEVFSGTNHFWNLVSLREKLEEDGLLLGCSGSQEDLFPGGMLGQTSCGKMMRVFDDNYHPTEVVSIYAPIDLDKIDLLASFGSQKKFRKMWLQQARKGRFY